MICFLGINNIIDFDYDFYMIYVEDYKERIKMFLYFEILEF